MHWNVNVRYFIVRQVEKVRQQATQHRAMTHHNRGHLEAFELENNRFEAMNNVKV